MNDWMEQDFLYNPGTDLILNLGTHLIEREDQEWERDELLNIFSSWDEDELLNDIQEMYQFVIENIDEGMQFFIQNPILPSFESEEWENTIDALNAFDEILYMLTGLSCVLSKQANNIINKLETKIIDMVDWLSQSKQFSYLRLVPLNSWRNKRLEYIPEHNHYQYPWYSNLSNIDSNTIDLLQENWISICKNGYNALNFINEDDRPIVWHYLERDGLLQQKLTKNKKFEQLLIKAVDQNIPVRLLDLSLTYARTRLIPKKYLSIGNMALAYTVLTSKKRINADESDLSNALEEKIKSNKNLDVIFCFAFCGPTLSRKKRLKAFQIVYYNMEQGIQNKQSFLKINELESNGWIGQDSGNMYKGTYNKGNIAKYKEIAFKTDKNTFELPILFDEDKNIQFFPEDKIEKNFITTLKKEGAFYGGWLKKIDHNIEKLDLTDDILDFQDILKPGDYEFIIIGCSSDDDILEKALDGGKPEDDNEASKIIWLIYYNMEQENIEPQYDIFSSIKLWSQNKDKQYGDKEFADDIFTYWDQLRDKAYDFLMKNEIPDIVICSKHNELRNKQWTDINCGILYYGGYNSNDTDDKKIAFQMNKNTFELPILFDKSGKIQFYPKDKIEKNFITTLENEGAFYGGWFKKIDHNIEKLDPTDDILNFQDILKPGDYEFIIIGCSSDDDILKKALSEGKPEDDNEASKIIWLIYTKGK